MVRGSGECDTPGIVIYDYRA
ncbi:hypothetical protein FMEAI12_6670001 [Parafrankia sp. Ea1.12]|nr:hypothetical protein FMEAI12_6670001 [Parafrankia sp. Ea1.12]